MMKHASECVRTNDPVIRSPAHYLWTTAPAAGGDGDLGISGCSACRQGWGGWHYHIHSRWEGAAVWGDQSEGEWTGVGVVGFEWGWWVLSGGGGVLSGGGGVLSGVVGFEWGVVGFECGVNKIWVGRIYSSVIYLLRMDYVETNSGPFSIL